MTTITKLDFSDVMYLPIQICYTGAGISVEIGHERHEITMGLTVDQAKELASQLIETLKEIE